MLKLFEIYNLDANYFFGRSEEPFLRDQSQKKNIVRVPDKAFAGPAIKADSLWNDTEYPRFSIPGMEGELFALEINGDSMLPTLTDGDLVICEPLDRTSPFRENQIYIVVTDMVVAKRIQGVKKNGVTTHIRLHSDNSIFQPYEVPIEEVQMIMNIKLRLTNYAIH
jgi:phage repressor protein C with HTH and peptisase S24 domain